jgi:cellulose synthase/poly-beta-1,6-N-acetylglucosamine synthase-like glycosyltransferase
VVVVDASSGRLDQIRLAHPTTHWIDFTPLDPSRVSIANQRNVGVRAATGDIIVFIDAGCLPEKQWLEAITAPIVTGEERMTCGQTAALGRTQPYEWARADQQRRRYLLECPTINVAFEREVFDTVGEFDESFDYGSDIDFTWRAVHFGIRIRAVPDALLRHDYGSRWRQTRRSYVYGYGRAGESIDREAQLQQP